MEYIVGEAVTYIGCDHGTNNYYNCCKWDKGVKVTIQQLIPHNGEYDIYVRNTVNDSSCAVKEMSLSKQISKGTGIMARLRAKRHGRS